VKLVVLDGYTTNPGDNPWTPLETLGELQVFDWTSSEQVIDRALDAEVLITNKTKLNATHFEKLSKLKLVSVLATGFDVVDIHAAKEHQVTVSNIPEYSTHSVAQHVFTGLLALLNRPEEHHHSILAGKWIDSGQFSFWNRTLVELAGQTMGIVGLGRIGKSVAKLADAFGMKVVANSRSRNAHLPYPGFQWLDIEELFSISDVVSLHCPATPATIQMVNADLISKMKPKAVLINTARGSLVNELDLAAALNAGNIGGAFLDVVSLEPIPSDNPLLTARNCLLTPHLAWATLASRRRLLQKTAENVAAFLEGRPINVVSR
jgi:glycerate dehydrogenase